MDGVFVYGKILEEIGNEKAGKVRVEFTDVFGSKHRIWMNQKDTINYYASQTKTENRSSGEI